MDKPILLNIQKVNTDSGEKTIGFYHGDLCTADEGFDVVVCSAARNSYYPSYGTLICSLFTYHGIRVGELACHPEIDMNERGCWLSKETASAYARRVACVEPINYNYESFSDSPAIGGMFSALVDLLEAADKAGIKIEHIAMPILGSGRQHMSIEYIVPQLISNCTRALKIIPGLKKISIYERKREKIEYLVNSAGQISDTISKGDAEKVFISYSHLNSEKAKWLQSELLKKGISCWMAPGSIPIGSDYTSEIPVVLGTIPVFLLLLTKESESSKWVKRELVTAIDSGMEIIPFCPVDYNIKSDFRIMLAVNQIYEAWRYKEDEQIQHILDIATAKK